MISGIYLDKNGSHASYHKVGLKITSCVNNHLPKAVSIPIYWDNRAQDNK